MVAGARRVRIDERALLALDPSPAPPLDPEVHALDGSRADRAAYVLALDAVNFGSGWFAELGESFGYETVARGLRGRWTHEGPWSAAELRALRTREVAGVVGLEVGHPLARLFCRALRELGHGLADRTAVEVVDAAGGSGQTLVERLRTLRMWRDPGFLKRAQIAVSDLALAEVTSVHDLDRLTVFADNLLPHVLRVEGALVLDAALAAQLDAGEPLRRGAAERELRAAAVHACGLLASHLGVREDVLDNALWTWGQDERFTRTPPHRTRTVFY